MCKFRNKNVFLMLWHFLCGFFSIFQFSAFTENRKFPKTVSATIFGLIIHIIKFFQTVQIQIARFKIY